MTGIPNPPPKNDSWLSPSTILTAAAMIIGIGGSYAAFDSRITRVETRSERLAVIEAKLDRLIETERVR